MPVEIAQVVCIIYVKLLPLGVCLSNGMLLADRIVYTLHDVLSCFALYAYDITGTKCFRAAVLYD